MININFPVVTLLLTVAVVLLPADGKCYKGECGCPGNFLMSWCDEDSAPQLGPFCEESSVQCGKCGGEWCALIDVNEPEPIDQPVPSVPVGTCFIGVCGCPWDFQKPWCKESKHSLTGEFCAASPENCEASCGGAWCSPPTTAPTPAPTLKPTLKPTPRPTQEPTPAPTVACEETEGGTCLAGLAGYSFCDAKDTCTVGNAICARRSGYGFNDLGDGLPHGICIDSSILTPEACANYSKFCLVGDECGPHEVCIMDSCCENKPNICVPRPVRCKDLP